MNRLAPIALLAVVVVSGCGSKQETTAASAPVPAAAAGQQTAPNVTEAVAGAEVGSMMPAYSAKYLDGAKLDLAAEHGHVVFLNLWATWCGPCRYEIPELQALHDKYAPKGFKVIGVSLDESGVAAVKEFAAAQKMTYPIAIDPEGRLSTVLQTSVVPTSVLIDRSGRIVWKRFGVVSTSDETLTSALQQALARG